MHNLAIISCTSPPFLAPRSKTFIINFVLSGPAEPEADMLPSEPERRTQYEYDFILQFCSSSVKYSLYLQSTVLGKSISLFCSFDYLSSPISVAMRGETIRAS